MSIAAPATTVATLTCWRAENADGEQLRSSRFIQSRDPAI